MLRNIFWKIGVLGDYKIEFWKFALRRLARGEIEHLIASMIVAHHLIVFATRSLQRPAKCVELFRAVARGFRPCRVISQKTERLRRRLNVCAS